jgi:DNA mismatch endonuclease (patch repair protein)
MQGNKGRDTRPEVALRAALHRAGVRFRKEQPPLRGVRRRADVVIRKYRLAVFLDGCFWHGCPEHYRPPRTNPGYWATKVARNRDRDADTDRRLREAGWTVVRVWEHESATEAAERVRALVHGRRADRAVQGRRADGAVQGRRADGAVQGRRADRAG